MDQNQKSEFFNINRSNLDDSSLIATLLETFQQFLLLVGKKLYKEDERIISCFESRIYYINDSKEILKIMQNILFSLISIFGAKRFWSLTIHWLQRENYRILKIYLDVNIQYLKTYETRFPLSSFLPYLLRFLSSEYEKIQKKAELLFTLLYSLYGEKLIEKMGGYVGEYVSKKKVNKLLDKLSEVSFTPVKKQNNSSNQPQSKHRNKIKTQTKPKTHSNSKHRKLTTTSTPTNLKHHTVSTTKKPRYSQKRINKNVIRFGKKAPLLSTNWKEASDSITPTKVTSEHNLQTELAKILYTLENDQGEKWENRYSAMIKLQSLINGGATRYRSFPKLLKSLLSALGEQLKDLRSQIVKQCCFLIAHLARALGNSFSDHFMFLFEYLINLVYIKIQVISQSGDFCIKEAILNMTIPRVIPVIKSYLNSKHVSVRVSSIQYLFLILSNWNTNELGRHVSHIEEILLKCIHDPNLEVRKKGRSTIWEFLKHFPERGKLLISNQDQTTQKNIMDVI
ncbi:clip-associating protein [Anaeramoeba flamelloides]|uniref:Clip-associating protein n=1 Tax=Anaeramoeba flamelloides TaxID=1746091 RepID=A0ABQ8Y7R3_9EUKA|nr:clip-associating protein [Anaeramoeba flamelloides]